MIIRPVLLIAAAASIFAFAVDNGVEPYARERGRHLIAMKEAAGRPKDLLAASEYRVISDEQRRPREDAER